MHDTAKIQIQGSMLSELALRIHNGNAKVGWWDDSEHYEGGSDQKIPDKYLIPTKLCLAHSEISEALEGIRKNLNDDHLPQHPMVMVEIGDAIIRLLDLAGYLTWVHGYAPIGQVVNEKIDYNDHRLDHKRETRNAAGGKSV